jgi:tRNA(fMet)-specific endonuclease VapC
LILHRDTNIVVAHLRGDASVTEHLKQHRGEMAMSALVYCELIFGARNATRPDLDIEDVHNVTRIAPVVAFGPECAETYARIRLALRRSGQIIGDTDLLIAAMAVAHGAILVTHNTKHFSRVAGLQLEDWLA